MTEVVRGGNSPGGINALLMWQQVRAQLNRIEELSALGRTC